jgi:hypothetical protein
MQIRALTGFSEQTIRDYGRSYSPLTGYRGKTIIGAMGPIGAGPYQDEEIETLPTYIPPQTITVKNKKTGEVKTFNVDNILQVVRILWSGFELIRELRGGTGSQQVDTSNPPPETKGISTEVLIGLGAVALIFLIMNRR